MKNIHLLQTSQPSRLQKFTDVDKIEFELASKNEFFNKGINIYITSDEEIKESDWTLKFPFGDEIFKNIKVGFNEYVRREQLHTYPYDWCKKIILTTDADLIKDGVQAIPDEFLEWFIKNPSCEFIKVGIGFSNEDDITDISTDYLIIFPKEELTKDKIDKFFVDMVCNSKEEAKQLFTDYPITELGDEEFKEAPIRECELLFYDDNKYCYVKVEGIEKEIKRCYIYPQKGRCGDIDCVSINEIKEFLKEEPKER